MKKIVVFIFLCAHSALAADYNCVTKANASLGFNDDISIRVSPGAQGGIIYGDEGEGEVAVGLVNSFSSLSGGTQFNLILGLFGGFETSGLRFPGDVSRIIKYSSNPIDSDESSVIRFFQGAHQIGGTFVLRGEAIACLPK